MTNALAIAAVTQTLKAMLKDALGAADIDAIGVPDVTSAPPDTLLESDETDRLNIYPWKITSNAAFANERLPSISERGARLTSPRLALDMHFILTATGTADLNAPILLGFGMQKFHEHPVLSEEDISDGLNLGLDDTEAELLPAAEKILRSSDLAAQLERIKITPALTEDEELTKLWPALNAALRTSTLYKVSVVLLETKRDIVAGPPVREVALMAFPMRRPTINRITAQQGDAEGILLHQTHPQAGTRVAITGTGFVADDMELWVGGVQIDLSEPAHFVSDQKISVVLPDTLSAGLQLARIDHLWTAETEPKRRIRETSKGGAFVIAPTVVSTSTDMGAVGAGGFTGPITLTTQNALSKDQSARLFLMPADDSLLRRGITATERAGPSAELSFETTDLPVGTYSYVLAVDGGETEPASISIGVP